MRIQVRTIRQRGFAYNQLTDRLVAAIVARFDEPDRHIFFHAFVEDLSNEEIATKVGRTTKQVAYRKHELRKFVKEELKAMNGGADDGTE